MTNEIPTRLKDLQQLAITTLTALETQNSEDLKQNLMDHFRDVYSELKKETSATEYNISLINNPDDDISNETTMHLIIQHMLQNNEESPLFEHYPEIIDDYKILCKIKEKIKKKDYSLLKNFLIDNKLRGELLFLYHVLSYIKLLNENSTKDAIRYIRNNFIFSNINDSLNGSENDLNDNLYNENDTDEPYSLIFKDINYRCEIKSLLTLIIFNSNIPKAFNEYTKKCIKQIERDFAEIRGITTIPALETLFNGGTESLYSLLKASEISNLDKAFTNEIPIDLQVKTKYHSIFICPILKIFCGDDNKPARLKCGHVISMQAVTKLCKEGILLSFKCPYCPSDCKVSDIKILKL